MKSYGQYCAIARGLDVVGERWSFLIVRELLGGPRRYGELARGLPGVATNLLARRLRDLVGAGVVERRKNGRYALTRWGEGLREPLYALARWSAPVVMAKPAGGDAFRSEWLVHPVAVIFGGVDERRPALTVEVQIGDEPMTIESRGGRVTSRPGHASSPDLVLAGPPDAVLGALAGRLGIRAAAMSGVSISGDARLLARLRPSLPGPPRAPTGG